MAAFSLHPALAGVPQACHPYLLQLQVCFILIFCGGFRAAHLGLNAGHPEVS